MNLSAMIGVKFCKCVLSYWLRLLFGGKVQSYGGACAPTKVHGLVRALGITVHLMPMYSIYMYKVCMYNAEREEHQRERREMELSNKKSTRQQLIIEIYCTFILLRETKIAFLYSSENQLRDFFNSRYKMRCFKKLV